MSRYVHETVSRKLRMAQNAILPIFLHSFTTCFLNSSGYLRLLNIISPYLIGLLYHLLTFSPIQLGGYIVVKRSFIK